MNTKIISANFKTNLNAPMTKALLMIAGMSVVLGSTSIAGLIAYLALTFPIALWILAGLGFFALLMGLGYLVMQTVEGL
jgi:hypothetical protein